MRNCSHPSLFSFRLDTHDDPGQNLACNPIGSTLAGFQTARPKKLKRNEPPGTLIPCRSCVINIVRLWGCPLFFSLFFHFFFVMEPPSILMGMHARAVFFGFCPQKKSIGGAFFDGSCFGRFVHKKVRRLSFFLLGRVSSDLSTKKMSLANFFCWVMLSRFCPQKKPPGRLFFVT